MEWTPAQTSDPAWTERPPAQGAAAWGSIGGDLEDQADLTDALQGLAGAIPDVSGLVTDTDERLSDPRTPTAHAVSHAADGDDPLPPPAVEVFYAERTTSQTTTSETDVAGLTGTVPAGLGRPIVVEVGGGRAYHANANGEIDIHLYQSTNGGPWSLVRVFDGFDPAGSAAAGRILGAKARFPASSDERAFKVALRTAASSGTAFWTMAANRPGWLHCWQL